MADEVTTATSAERSVVPAIERKVSISKKTIVFLIVSTVPSPKRKTLRLLVRFFV